MDQRTLRSVYAGTREPAGYVVRSSGNVTDDVIQECICWDPKTGRRRTLITGTHD